MLHVHLIITKIKINTLSCIELFLLEYTFQNSQIIMDVAFELSYVVPAILFTLLAIVFASTIFSKKPISASPSKTECEVAKTGLTESIDERNDLATELIHKADKVKADEVVPSERIKEQTESALVTPAENIGVLEEHPGAEFGNKSVQARPETKKSDIKDPVAEPVPQKETVDDAVPEAVPVEESTAQLLPEPASDGETASQVPPMRGPPHGSEAVPRKEETPDDEAESSPVFEGHSVIGAAGEEEGYEPLKYAPGKLRTSQLEQMMTREELEEEQRSVCVDGVLPSLYAQTLPSPALLLCADVASL